jgi:hypothetical protein
MRTAKITLALAVMLTLSLQASAQESRPDSRQSEDDASRASAQQEAPAHLRWPRPKEPSWVRTRPVWVPPVVVRLTLTGLGPVDITVIPGYWRFFHKPARIKPVPRHVFSEV